VASSRRTPHLTACFQNLLQTERNTAYVFKTRVRETRAAGVKLQAYNLSFNDRFTDEEIDRGFQMAQALGVRLITSSSTLTAAKRVAPFADRYKITVAMHGHRTDLSDER
jgi:hypothetical protein